jgi:hypothetical protein
MHIQRIRRLGDPGGPESWIGTRGEWRLNDQGYMVRVEGGRYLLEHREVMAEIIGRPLAPWEEVHHKNTLRSDNHPSNLELWVKPQPRGARPIDLAAWVAEFYPEELERLGWTRPACHMSHVASER